MPLPTAFPISRTLGAACTPMAIAVFILRLAIVVHRATHITEDAVATTTAAAAVVATDDGSIGSLVVQC